MEPETEKRRGRQPKEAPSAPQSHEVKRVRIKHYKVYTSQGRFIEADRPWLPAHEADDLLAKGHAIPC